MDRHGDLGSAGTRCQPAMKVGDRVRVGEGIGRLKTGLEAVIVQGPITVSMVSGVFVVRADNGEEEQVHVSRLRAAVSSRSSVTFCPRIKRIARCVRQVQRSSEHRPPEFDQHSANGNDVRSVHTQRENRRPPGGCPANEPGAGPAEVVAPAILAGMEQRDQFAGSGVTCLGPGGLLQRAGDACERQIIGVGRSFGGAGRNVIEVKRGLLQDLRKMAVFANVASTRADKPDERRRNVLAHFLRFFDASSARRRIRESKSTSPVSAVASRRSRRDSLPAWSCRSSSSCRRSWSARGKRNRRQSLGSSSSTSTVMGHLTAPHNHSSDSYLFVPQERTFPSLGRVRSAGSAGSRNLTCGSGTRCGAPWRPGSRRECERNSCEDHPGPCPRLSTIRPNWHGSKVGPGRAAKPLVSLTDPRGLPPLVASRQPPAAPRPRAPPCKLALIDYAGHCIPISYVVFRVCKRARSLCKLASIPPPAPILAAELDITICDFQFSISWRDN